MPDPIRRDALLRLKVETDLARAVDTAARQRGQNTSEFVRQSLRAQLAADGIHVPPISPGDVLNPQPATPTLREAA